MKYMSVWACVVFFPVPSLTHPWGGRCRCGGERQTHFCCKCVRRQAADELTASPQRHTPSTRLCTISTNRPKAQMTNLGTRLAAMHHEGSLPQGCAGVAPEAAQIYTDLSPPTSASHCFSHIDTYPRQKHLNESRSNSLSYPQHTKSEAVG